MTIKSYKSFKIVCKVACLGVSVEQVQDMLILYKYLHVKDSFVRQGVAHYSICEWFELSLYNREPRKCEQTTVRSKPRKERGRVSNGVIDQTCLLSVTDQSLLSGVECCEDLLVAYDIKII